MEQLEPISSPPGHVFREFCHRVLPILVFALAGLTATVLWNRRFTGTLLFGEVEPVRANVTTVEAGSLAGLLVERFQSVTNGQPIATLEVLDSDAMARSVEVLRAELEVMRARMGLDEARNEQNVEALRVRWLEARVELATAKVSLENARRDLERATRLFAEKILSEAEHDLAQSSFDALEIEVRERTVLVEGLASSLKALDATNQRDRSGSGDTLKESLAAQERQLASAHGLTLRAPMDGIVKVINNHQGERVPAGSVVAVITAPQAQRIVGYVRQPLALRPRPGMPVEIRTRSAPRQVRESRITDVGADLELVTSPLRLRGFDNAVERGLAFFVELPLDLEVHPGELVDLLVRPVAE